MRAETLAGYGLPHVMIARLIGVSEPTLRKHLSNELKLGEAKATSQVSQNLYNRATKQNDLGAMIFWLKARAGWRETQRVENTGPDGKPAVTTVVYKWAEPKK